MSSRVAWCKGGKGWNLMDSLVPAFLLSQMLIEGLGMPGTVLGSGDMVRSLLHGDYVRLNGE